MKPPRGFEPFPFFDGRGIEERRFEFTHRRKIRNGWAYWNASNPREIMREVWLSSWARSITYKTLKGNS